MNDALTPIPDGNSGDPICDYALHPEFESVWVEVGSISVHIIRTDEGAIVDLYAKGLEMEDEIASCQAFEKEAQQMIEESKDAQDEQLPETICEDGSIAIQNPPSQQIDLLDIKRAVDHALQEIRSGDPEKAKTLLEMTLDQIIRSLPAPENFDHDPRFDEGGEFHEEANPKEEK